MRFMSPYLVASVLVIAASYPFKAQALWDRCGDKEPNDRIGTGGVYYSAPMGVSFKAGLGLPLETTLQKNSNCYLYKVIGADIEVGRPQKEKDFGKTLYKLGIHYAKTEGLWRS